MQLNEVQFDRVVSGVNDAYFAINEATARDPYQGVEAARRNAPRLAEVDGVDVLIPPISLRDFDALSVVPFEARIGHADIEGLQVSTEGVVKFGLESHDKRLSDGRLWKYKVCVDEVTGEYRVERTARNGDAYSFSTSKPELVTRAAEILLGKLTDNVNRWKLHSFASD